MIDDEQLKRIEANARRGVFRTDDVDSLLAELRYRRQWARDLQTLVEQMARTMTPNTKEARAQIFPAFKEPSIPTLVALTAFLFGHPLDDLHHAPLCPANHFCRQRVPTGGCTCGASSRATG